MFQEAGGNLSMPTVGLDGVTAIAAILIASFAIDRFVEGILFLLSFNRRWSQLLPDPVFPQDDVSRYKMERRRKLVRMILATLVAVPLLAFFGQMRILFAVGFESINPILDQIFTAIILIGGAGQMTELLKWGGGHRVAGDAASSKPVEITGKLILEEKASGAMAKGAS